MKRKVRKNRFGMVLQSEVYGLRDMLQRYANEAVEWVAQMVGEVNEGVDGSRSASNGAGESGGAEQQGNGSRRSDGKDPDETEEEDADGGGRNGNGDGDVYGRSLARS